MGGGNKSGMRVATGRYFFLLNSDAWVVGDGLDRLVAYADARPRLRSWDRAFATPTGRSSGPVRAEPTV